MATSTPNPSTYFSGQGTIMVAFYDPEDPNKMTPFMKLGNVPDFKLAFNVTKQNHKESSTGLRQTDSSIVTENTCTLSATMESWTNANIAMATRGKTVTVPAGAITAEVGRFDAVEANQIWTLDHQKVSAVVVSDSSPTPSVVTSSFEIDAIFGTLSLKEGVDTSGWEFPLTVAYTYGAVELVTFFSASSQMAYLRFEGVNTARNGEKCLVEVYKVELDPTKELGLISDNYGQFALEGSAYIDVARLANEKFGQFGRYVSGLSTV